jgi:hypothetical protein
MIILYGSIFYGFSKYSNADLPKYANEFKPAHFWLFLIPIASSILWFWALYDWGTTQLTTTGKLMWLFLIVTLYCFGATAYFLLVGLKSKERTQIGNADDQRTGLSG